MTRPAATIGSLAFLILAPGFVAGVVPRWISDGQIVPGPLAIVGGILIAVSFVALLACFARFAWQGRGTPAPVLPTDTLVITGLYRYVRNPMYLAEKGLILGQALLFASSNVLLYGAFVCLMFHLVVYMYEEPRLRATYRMQYDDYCSHVRRWIPRPTAWTPA